MENTDYIFSIDAFTPETLPMKRLAQYMEQLATLYGCSDQVHFLAVEKGSAVLKVSVEHTAVPKVDARLTSIQSNDAPADAEKAWDELNGMLQRDNATGYVGRAGGAKIINFPGRETPMPDFKGTLAQVATLDGRIVGINGADSTKHVHIDFSGEKTFSCECREDIARSLKAFLYEPEEIRVHGNARYGRNEKGKWELKKFTITHYETLDNTPLSESVAKLRKIEGDWGTQKDAWAALMHLRHEGNEAH